jgi:hypothetical protein
MVRVGLVRVSLVQVMLEGIGVKFEWVKQDGGAIPSQERGKNIL